MKRLLLLVAKGNGPGNGHRWNSEWPLDLENAISNNLWKMVTPGVLLLAALTDPSQYQIDLIDEEFDELNPEIFYDLVAMYTVTPNVQRSYRLADNYRLRGTYVVFGGVHTLICPEEVLLHADTIFIGEAEETWPRFLKDFASGNPEKRYFQSVGTVDIKHSPVPEFRLLPETGRKIIPIQTARGCSHGCGFCNLRNIYGYGYRTKTIEQINEEIKAALEINPRAIIYFTDDNLFSSLKHAGILLVEIKRYNITWYANSDLLFGKDTEFLNNAYQSGCRQVLIGFESINPVNLKGLDENNFKNRHVLEYRSIIDKIQKNGIGVIGSFIVGLDDDDQTVFDQLSRFVIETRLFGASITINTPYPGTKIFEKMVAEDRITTYDWDQYTIFQPVFNPLKMTPKELNEGYIRLLKNINSKENALQRLLYFKDRIKALQK